MLHTINRKSLLGTSHHHKNVNNDVQTITFSVGFTSWLFLCLVQNTGSPWLHPAAGSAGDAMGLLSHVPVRPASADPHRHPIKMSAHASPPLSKAGMNAHKE